MPSPQNDSFWRFLPCIPRGIPVARYATIALSLARRRRCHWMSLPLFRDGFDEIWKRIVKLSPSHLMFWLQGLVFTGDTLFVAGLDPWNFPTPATFPQADSVGLEIWLQVVGECLKVLQRSLVYLPVTCRLFCPLCLCVFLFFFLLLV